ncbi:metalloregulator ArsR/SmtB family transcription factor [Streptomyces sp. NPDC093085]|uniref:ArsR/SmtB family transcription factor n=1 Tax=Streptomyces sp. NPDC093085 TaxID=3155068 RepID=UPI00341C8558
MSKQEFVVLGRSAGTDDGAGGSAGDSTDNGAGDDVCCPTLLSAPLDEETAHELARVFKALGDPVRLRLLSMIASRDGGEVCVCDLTPAFDLSQPTISHHLKLLKQAGLIGSERRGTWVYYRLLPETTDRLAAVLTRPGTAPAEPVDAPAEPVRAPSEPAGTAP